MSYQWTAVYKDSKELKEFEGSKQNLFRDIDLEKLEIFKISNSKSVFSVNVLTGQFNLNGLPVFSYSLPRGNGIKYKLIYFKRNRLDFTPQGVNKSVQYVIGLECNHSNKSYQQLIWVQEDGSVIINGFK